MKDLICLNTIITDNLAVHIDLTNLKSWNLNTGFISVSLSKWGSATVGNTTLYDFGLTAYDNGRVNKMYSGLTLTSNDNKVTLYQIGYNNATGGTFYTPSGIVGVTGTTIGTGITATTLPPAVGRYFKVNGGYLQGFYKLKGYNYELVPSRFANGVTIESLMYISGTSYNDGYFYYMGQRAEDKYLPAFSGESIQYTTTTTAVTNGSRGTVVSTVSKLNFSGVTTSLGHFLNNYVQTTTQKTAINDQNQFQTGYTGITDLGINDNVIGFFISSDKRIGYSRINTMGLVESNVSDNMLGTGWTLITIVFNPYQQITDPKLLCCTDRRMGDFTVYVNGRRFWKITDYPEFYFRSTPNDKEKQIGVPYNISWGGGSFGLKHSYHYDTNVRIVFSGNTAVTGTTGHSSVYSTGFTAVFNPIFSGDCLPINPAQYYSQLAITGDNKTFYTIDECATGTTAATSVLKLHNKTINVSAHTITTGHTTIVTGATIITGTTGGTGHTGTTFITGYTTIITGHTATTVTVSGKTTNEYYIRYNKTLSLLSNRDYIFEFDVYDPQIFAYYNQGKIGMVFSGETPITILEEVPYIYSNLYAFTNQWRKVRYRIRTKDNTALTKVNAYFAITSDAPLNIGFTTYFKDFIFWGSDKLSKDKTKDNELIEQTYSKPFVGAIQKLRLYTTAFNSQEVLHNASIEFDNPAYGVIVSLGGRIIYK